MTELRLIPNPGGHLSPDEVIGRDSLVETLWDTLEQQSVVLTAERRMGKTATMDKMMSAPPGHIRFVYCDLEQVHTAAEFADLIYRKVDAYMGAGKRFKEGLHRALEKFKGASLDGVGGITLDVASTPWKVLLDIVMAELARDHQPPFVFFWDELPLMIKSIADREGDEQAMEVLDALRAARQTYDTIRMVYTGSIGLHHALGRLKRVGYANDPTNDMSTIEVPPLSPPDAQLLARGLLAGAGISAEHHYKVAAAMAEATSGIPFFIHYVAKIMREKHKRVDANTVEEIIRAVLVDSGDPWHLSHYQSRIKTYYREKDQRIVLVLLDIFAAHERPLTFNEVFGLVKAQVRTEDAEHVREVLMLLRQDHYVVQEQDGTYRFRFGIIQRWWRLHRGLEVIG